MRRWLARGGGVVTLAALAAAAAYGPSLYRGADAPDEPLAEVPAEAGVILTLDVRRVLDSTLWRASLDEAAGAPRRIERTCGYDPLAEVGRATVFFLGADDRPFETLGVVAHGEVARGGRARERLVRCVGAVLAEQGGASRRVEVEGVPAMRSARGGSHAAFLGADGIVAGDEEVVARLIRVSRGEAPAADRRPELAALRSLVGPRQDVVLIARLPRRWLDALRRMAGELPAELDGLTSVRALALGADLRAGLDARLALRASAAGAPELEAAVRAQRDALLAERETRLSVVGSALRRLRVDRRGADVTVSLRIGDDVVEDLAALWRELRADDEAPGSVGDLDLDDVPRGRGGRLGGGGLVEPVTDPQPGDDPGRNDDDDEQ